jgi:hypothetical protein
MKRPECVRKLAKEKTFWNEFMAKRVRAIEQLRAGRKVNYGSTKLKRPSHAESGTAGDGARSESESEVRDVKRTVLKNKREHGTLLKRPPISCLPYEVYITQFPIGEMKRRKHKVKWVGNKKMVLMPPEKGVPWTLEDYDGEVAELEETITSGEEDLPPTKA